MASQSSITNEKVQIILKYQVNQQQETDLLIRYTKTFTRELVFAVDMMNFVMEDNNLHFENYITPNCLGTPCSSDFDAVMKKLVSLMLTKYKPRAMVTMEKNVNLDHASYAEFKCFANASAIKMEDSEFGEYAFLVFCVLMAQMCSIAYLHGLRKAPEFGIMLMCRTYSNLLIKSALSQSPWEAIKIVARNAAELLEIEQ